MNSEFIFQVVKDFYYIGYCKLKKRVKDLEYFNPTNYTIEDYKNDMFVYLSKYNYNYDSKKSNIKTYMNNYILPKLNAKIMADSGQYKEGWFSLTKNKATKVNSTSLDSEDYLYDTIESNKKYNSSYEFNFWNKALKYVVENTLLRDGVTLKDKYLNDLIELIDYLDGFNNVEKVHELLPFNLRTRIRKMMDEEYGIKKIEDIPISLGGIR